MGEKESDGKGRGEETRRSGWFRGIVKGKN